MRRSDDEIETPSSYQGLLRKSKEGSSPEMKMPLELKPSFALVPLPNIVSEPNYLLRYSAEDSGLVSLLKQFGFVSPLFAVEKEGGQYKIISGHKRFSAATQIAMKFLPVWFVPSEVLSPAELFQMALLLNVSSVLTDLDRSVVAVKGIEQFGFSWEEMEQLARLFGLPPSRKVLGDYYAVGKMPDAIQKEIYEGRIPFKAARSLCDFDSEQRNLFVREIFSHCEFTASEAQEVVEWLSDIVRRDKINLRGLISMEIFRNILFSNQLEAKEKGRKFHQRLRVLRFPSYSAVEEKFKKIKNALEKEKEVRLEKTPFFEKGSFSLSLTVDSVEKLRFLVDYLARNESLFKDLFDLVQ